MMPSLAPSLLRAPLALAAALAVAACQSLIPGATRDPPRLYELTPKSTFDPTLPRVRSQLVVETLEAASGLTTSRIAVKQRPTTLEWFETARNYAVYSNEGGFYDDIITYLKLPRPKL